MKILTDKQIEELKEKYPAHVPQGNYKGYKDVNGQKFGRLLVLYRGENRAKRSTVVCLCECGNVVSCIKNDLIQGKQVSCGCLNNENRKNNISRSPQDLTNMIFGNWKVLHRSTHTDARKHPYWDCKCLGCGVILPVRADYLKGGQSTSCGCSIGQFKKLDLENRIFGSVRAICPTDINNPKIWKCECLKCGNICYFPQTTLQGSTKKDFNCGCCD